MAKAKRTFIRISGKLIGSPSFVGKDAQRQLNEWLEKKQTEKDFIERGLMSSDAPTFLEYATKWFKRRMDRNPQSTWSADETRLRLYLLPALSEFPMNRITRTQLRAVLTKAQDDNGLSVVTRTRIKALASKIFSDAMNEDPPLVVFNPCAGLKFEDARQGRKMPATLQDPEEVRAFLLCANDQGPLEAILCAVAVMSGLRKSELIPLRYRNVNRKRGLILVDSHCEQVSQTIKPGTKAGTNETREVFVPEVLIEMIEAYRRASPFGKADDFIFCDPNGDWIRPRKLHSIIDQVVKAYGRPITLHKLRHTFGRLFVAESGNPEALQAMLGHKSAATTALYSTLSGNQLKKFGEVMNVFKADQTPQSSKALTQKRHKATIKHEED